MESSGVLPTAQFAYRKGLGTCDALSCMSHTLQNALESWQEARIAQIDFSAPFDRVNHQGILKLCSVGIGDSVFSMYYHRFWRMVEGVNWLTSCQECRRELFLARYCSTCRPPSFFIFWRISWSVNYADDSFLIAVLPSPGRNLIKVSEWCYLWGMKLNASKTKTIIVSRSRTMHPLSPVLTIGGTVLNESDDLVILGVTFDSKMTFETNLRSVFRTASQRLGILGKSWQVFHDR